MNSIVDSLTRIKQIFNLPQRIDPNSIGSKDISVPFNSLNQLLNENLVDGGSAFNSQPTLKQFLDFGNSLQLFLNDDTQLQLQFFGSISCQLKLNQIHLSLDSFELTHKEKGIAMEYAIEILPTVSKFVHQYKADEFVLSNTIFFAWWD